MKRRESCRGDQIIRLLTLIKLFNDGARLTRRDVSERLGISIPVAHKYIDAMSIVFPLEQVNDGRPAVFGLAGRAA